VGARCPPRARYGAPSVAGPPSALCQQTTVAPPSAVGSARADPVSNGEGHCLKQEGAGTSASPFTTLSVT
jgi:hypothetical protein